MSKRPNLLAGQDLPPAPRQKRSAAKRERLKSAALTLFAEQGYEGASVDDIAGKANLAVGSFYQHFRSKRQLLLVLMQELLEQLSQVDLRLDVKGGVRTGLRELLRRAFSRDLRYLGAYRAWQEAALSDPDLARKQKQIHAWTRTRVASLFRLLERQPGTRPGVDVPALARAMDSFFWSLLAQAGQLRKAELNRWIDSATHLIYHALFTDPPAAGRQEA